MLCGIYVCMILLWINMYHFLAPFCLWESKLKRRDEAKLCFKLLNIFLMSVLFAFFLFHSLYFWSWTFVSLFLCFVLYIYGAFWYWFLCFLSFFFLSIWKHLPSLGFPRHDFLCAVWVVYSFWVLFFVYFLFWLLIFSSQDQAVACLRFGCVVFFMWRGRWWWGSPLLLPLYVDWLVSLLVN